MQISCTKCHENWTTEVKGMNIISFTPVSTVWLPLRQLSQKSQSIIKYFVGIYCSKFIQVWLKMYKIWEKIFIYAQK